MAETRRLLVVTDIFPPVAAVGTQRIVGLCRHAADAGWQVSVVTLRPRSDTTIDETLLARIPEGVRVVRTWAPDLPAMAARLLGRGSEQSRGAGETTKASVSQGKAAPEQAVRTPQAAPVRPGAVKRLMQWMSWWMYVPDSRSAWLPWGAWAAMRTGRPDAVFSSAPMWTSHLVAAAVAKLRRVPWVADFRDPWCGSTWRELPAGLHSSVDRFLERRVVAGATRITCAWDGIRGLLAERYPRRADHVSTILNGFEPEEIDPVETERVDAGRCVLIHAGTLYGPRSPMSLLAGLRQLRQERPAEAARLLVVLLGGGTWNGQSVSALAEQHGVGDLLRVMPSTAHRQAVAMLKGADAAILFGQCGHEGLAPVPAKVYEYVGAGKAVLSIGSGAEAEDILRRGGCTVWPAADSGPSCAAALGEMAARHAEGNRVWPSASSQRELFTRRAMAARLMSVIEEALCAGRG
jgi:hypothetical protein